MSIIWLCCASCTQQFAFIPFHYCEQALLFSVLIVSLGCVTSRPLPFLSLSLSRTHTLSLSHTHTHSHSLSHTHTLTLTHTHTHAHTHTHSHSHSHSLWVWFSLSLRWLKDLETRQNWTGCDGILILQSATKSYGSTSSNALI